VNDPNANQITTAAAAGRWFRLPVFEGPLDLLLHLIKKNELDPQEVTASIVTEQYLEYLELLDSLNLDVAGEYLVMAATLLLIKSFALLPYQAVADEEEAEELKRDLIARLLEYQRYREAAFKLAERPLLGRDVFVTPGEKLESAAEDVPIYDVSIFDLVEALRGVLARLAEQTARELDLRDIPVAKCIPVIMARLQEVERLEFISLFEDARDRSMVVAFFLGLLELIRRGQVRAFQEAVFGPIWLSRRAEAPTIQTEPESKEEPDY
jgi:segregation and condensation protein A